MVKEGLEILDELYLEEGKVRELADRLKRRALQQFIGAEQGIMVYDKDKFTVYGVAGKESDRIQK